MKLYLIRHAEALGSGDDLPDHDRPLTGEGQQQARALGVWLAQRSERPSRLHCSSARRALETARGILSELPRGVEPNASRDLYLASTQQLLELVCETPSAQPSLWIVGHNPGMAELALRLAGQGEPQALRRIAARFPPGACAQIAFSHDDWRAIEPGAGELAAYWTPAAK